MNDKKYVILPGDGNLMAATAIVHADTDVVAVYQITPSTQVSEHIAEKKRTGEFAGEVRVLHGEIEAYTACYTASQCGARVAGPSCSQGLLYASELLHAMPGARCPIVILAANREVSAPINIHAGHSDVMPFRDSGAVMFFAKNAQEVYDFTLLAFKIGEDKRVHLPVWVNYDGFEISHTTVINKILNEQGVKELREYLGTYERPCSMLNMEHPHATGGLVLPNAFMEAKYALVQAMQNVPKVMEEVSDFYSKNFWPVHSFVEEYELQDAEYAIITMGSRFGTVKEAVKRARANGEKVGALRIVSFRPFPVAKVRDLLDGKKAVAVLDRSGVYGSPMSPLCENVAGSLINMPFGSPFVRGFVDSLGGRVLTVEQVLEIIQSLKHHERWNDDVRSTWVGVEKGDTI